MSLAAAHGRAPTATATAAKARRRGSIRQHIRGTSGAAARAIPYMLRKRRSVADSLIATPVRCTTTCRTHRWPVVQEELSSEAKPHSLNHHVWPHATARANAARAFVTFSRTAVLNELPQLLLATDPVSPTLGNPACVLGSCSKRTNPRVELPSFKMAPRQNGAPKSLDR